VARRLARRSFTFDTFDAQRAGDPSVVEVLGRTHRRVVEWSDFERQELAPGLAASWEQPDRLTLVLQVRRDVHWHDVDPLGGRVVSPGDVVADLRRRLDLSGAGVPAVQRPQDLAAWDQVVADGDAVLIRLTRPDPFVLQTLAARFALVQAPEAVEAFAGRWHELRTGDVVGSGPYRLAGTDGAGGLVFVPVSARGVSRLEVRPASAGLEAFLAGDVDEFVAYDRRDAAAAARAGGVVAGTVLAERPVLSTLSVGAPPWDNVALRRALSLALHRGRLAEALFGGRAVASGPVPPVHGAWAPVAGVSSGTAEADAAEARALWEAGGGPALGTVTVDFPSIFDPLFAASSGVIGLLNAVLGPGQFRPAVETYTTISRKALDGAYGNGRAAFWFGWGPDFAEPEPSRWLWETYASEGPGFATTGYRNAAVDRLLTGLLQEHDVDRRRALVADVSELLTADAQGGVMHWLVQRFETFRRPYVRGGGDGPWWWQHLDGGLVVDADDPGYPGPR
jgi:peptide/nickel transport system substrate-binding protein